MVEKSIVELASEFKKWTQGRGPKPHLPQQNPQQDRPHRSQDQDILTMFLSEQQRSKLTTLMELQQWITYQPIRNVLFVSIK